MYLNVPEQVMVQDSIILAFDMAELETECDIIPVAAAV
jgi:hypothetical protein